MDLCLHLGAHRTATTLFQNYLDDNRDRLRKRGVGYWGPKRLRGGMLSGLMRNPASELGRSKKMHDRVVGRVRMELARAAQNGFEQLVISDENLLGSLRHNLDHTCFYTQTRARLARLAPAVGGNALRIGVAIRSYDTYWASVIAKRLLNGGAEQSVDVLDRLTTQPRRWRDVIVDISNEFPEAEIFVWSYESWGAQPSQPVTHLLDIATADLRPAARTRLNTSRDNFVLNKARARFGFPNLPIEGQYMPFSQAQRDKLHRDYASDIAWLAGGAQGRATYLTPMKEEFGQDGWFTAAPRHKQRVRQPDDRGRPNDRQEARMG